MNAKQIEKIILEALPDHCSVRIIMAAGDAAATIAAEFERLEARNRTTELCLNAATEELESNKARLAQAEALAAGLEWAIDYASPDQAWRKSARRLFSERYQEAMSALDAYRKERDNA